MDTATFYHYLDDYDGPGGSGGENDDDDDEDDYDGGEDDDENVDLPRLSWRHIISKAT